MAQLAYSGIELQSRKGLQLLLDFAERNQLMQENPVVVASILLNAEEEVVAECMSDYWDTLRDAMPRP